jgi:hypothetical protein
MLHFDLNSEFAAFVKTTFNTIPLFKGDFPLLVWRGSDT